MEKMWGTYKKPIIVGTELDNCERFGTLKVENNFITEFSEKKKVTNGLINAGCYLFPKRFLEKWRRGKKFSLEKDHLQKMPLRDQIMCFKSKGIFVDIGIIEDYEKAHYLLKNEL